MKEKRNRYETLYLVKTNLRAKSKLENKTIRNDYILTHTTIRKEMIDIKMKKAQAQVYQLTVKIRRMPIRQ